MNIHQMLVWVNAVIEQRLVQRLPRSRFGNRAIEEGFYTLCSYGQYRTQIGHQNAEQIEAQATYIQQSFWFI